MALQSGAGRKFNLIVNGKPFGCSQDVSLSITTSTTDTVGCREDAQAAGGGGGLVATTTRPTGYSWSITPAALFRFPTVPGDVATLVTIPQLHQLMLAGDSLTVQFGFTDDAGYSAVYTGSVYITDATLNAPLEGDATGDFTFTGSGNLTLVTTNPA